MPAARRKATPRAQAALTTHEPAARGLMRLLAQDIAAARDDVAAVTPATAALLVHRTRKRLKKARTIIRLLQPVLGGHAEPLRTALRRAQHGLAGQRDATVLADTAEELAAEMSDPEERGLLSEVATRARAAARHDFHPVSDLAGARAALTSAAQRMRRLRLSAEGEAVVRRRVADTYRKARKFWQRAEADPEVEVLHDWRKKVKDRLHVVRLFSRRWPEPIGRREAKLDRLGELLGRDHDLAMLDDALPRGLVADRLRAGIAIRRERLATKAFALAEAVFAEKPAKVAAAWTGNAPR